MNNQTNNLSPEAQAVLQALTQKQRRAIRKTYPFRPERNRVIRQLRQRGVPWHIIAEASGLSRSRVQQIGSIEDRTRNTVGVTSGVLKELKMVLEAFYKATLRLLNRAEERGGEKG